MVDTRKIIVFGATGDIGQYFVDYLNCQDDFADYEVIAVGSRNKSDVSRYGFKSYYQVDISRKDQFASLDELTNVYAVVHLAGAMPARMEGYIPQKYIDVNITGTLNILDFCVSHRVDRILYAQSFGDIQELAEKKCYLYADMARSFSFNNDHTVYVMTKNFAVDLIENYHQLYGIKKFIFRLPTIYLWSDIDNYYVDGKIRKIGYRLLIDKAMRGETIELWGDKSRKKDMVYVKDFCQMLYKALFVDRSKGYYNVGTGVGTTLEDQIKGIVDVFGSEGKKSEIVERPDLPNAPQYIMDITPAVNELGYTPQYDYISMLKDMKKYASKDAKE